MAPKKRKKQLWLSFKGSGHRQSKLKHEYHTTHKAFDKKAKKIKRRYQREEQLHLLDLCQLNPTLFWKKIKSLQIAKNRKSYIPTEIKPINVDIINNKDAVLEELKQAVEAIYDNK